MLIGPLSEVYGRAPIYRVSFTLFFAFSFPVAFAKHICELTPASILQDKSSRFA